MLIATRNRRYELPDGGFAWPFWPAASRLGLRRRGRSRSGVDGQAGDRRPGARAGAVGVAERGVVTLGTNTTAVPTDQIVSIRYDGQPATLQLAETRESAGQLAEAAELYKKAAGRGRPRSRSSCRWPCITRPPRWPIWRSSSRSGPRTPRTGCSGSSEPIPTAGTSSPPARTWRGFRSAPATSRRRGHHRRAGEAAQGRRARGRAASQAAGQAGIARRGHHRARSADRHVAGSLDGAARGAAGQSREPGRPEEIQGGRDAWSGR